jgi:hypothetical protein
MAASRSRSRSTSPLLNVLFKLNFIRTVEPPRRLPTPTADATVSLAAGDTNSPFCVNPPDAPSSTTPPSTSSTSSTTPPSTSSTPSLPGQAQAPPLPPITPVPPSFEPSPPENGAPGGGQGGGDQGQGGGGQGQGGPPASTTPNSPPQAGPGAPFGSVPPSPIVMVPSPPGFGPGPGSGSGGGSGSGDGGGPFQPPIVYPPPLAPPMLPGAGQTLWCVAKPTVPDPIIQEAMDYACGSGAECDSILPSGACYHPNTVLAHASFAFNSYWQQNKATGGTATIITRDPSKHHHQLPYLQCVHIS